MRMTRSQPAKIAGYHLCLAIPLLPMLGAYIGVYWLSPLVVFVAMPLLGLAIGPDKSRPLRYDVRRRAVTWLNAIPRIWVLLWFGVLVWTPWFISGFTGSSSDVVGVVFGVALASAFATPVAHELFHKRNPIDYWLGRVAVSICGFGQLMHEHVRHHQRAVTASDTSVPREGESVYRFAVRATVAGLVSAWHQDRRGRSPRPMLVDLLIVVAAYALFGLVWGAAGVAVLLCQALFAIFCFEAINYIQHYGLARRDAEPLLAKHSWEHYCWLSNCVTLNAPLHSDHHLHGERLYYELVRHVRESPRLPLSYIVMFLASLVPPLFSRLMHRAMLRHKTRPSFAAV